MLIAYDPLIPLVQSVRPSFLEHLVAVRLGPATAALPDGAVWFDEWLAGTTVPADFQIPSFDPAETVAVLQYTGGTTGRSKGAMLTHRNVVANAHQSAYFVPGGIQPNDVGLCALPLFHVYAMTICMNLPIAFGGTSLMVPRFDAKEIVSLIERYQVTMFPGVPTMYVALTQVLTPGSDALRSLRVCNSGGAPLPVQVLHRFEELSGAVMAEGYGLSESSPVTHSSLKERRKVGSIGIPAPNTEAKIVAVDDPAKELPVGEPGELAIRGPQVMKGYWNRPEETARTLVDGWLLTGDIAVIDEDGFTFIVDRKKDLIIASGYNVYPRDVEEALYQHPAVLEAAVVGVPDDYRGETVKAFIVLKPGMTVTEEELIAFCRENLAAYKVPRLIEFRDELPKTAVGKILRRGLKA
jgi:long-chain acyl-CoA synthetase